MIIDSDFATAMHATRCVSNTALGGYSPVTLVFNQICSLIFRSFLISSHYKNYDKQKLISVCYVPMPNKFRTNSNYMIKSMYTMLTLHPVN